ncbi:MAG: ATPase, T2SS/T4P/T4SS family [Fibrobacterales bacterium]
MDSNAVNRTKIGELLVSQEVITDEQLEHALEEQERTGLLLGKTLVLLGYVEDDALSAILGNQLQIQQKQRLGTVLVNQGIIEERDLERALEKQKETGEKLGKCLVSLGVITESKLVEVLAAILEVPQVKLANFQIEPEVISMIPEEMCRTHLIIPLYAKNNIITVAMTDPTNLRTVDHIKFKTQMDVDAVMATEEEITASLNSLYGGTSESLSSILEEDTGLETVEDSDENDQDVELTDEEGQQVVRVVNTIINEAISKGASDIHLEPQEGYLQLRYRVDGALIVNPPIPAKLMPQIISRLKILSKMDIAEKRKPLDGRFTVKYQGKEVDLRVSSFPSALRKRGISEKIVLRILDPNSNNIPLEGMGFQESMLKSFKQKIALPNGIILVTGPTGSGKSTTLYACVKDINKPEINIVTMEDPVEMNLEGVTQGQINNAAGFTFAAGLKAILRQDPDVIMLGEMRDLETAAMAIESALTGHMVFSTLHTNDAAGAYPRLLDMGLEPFLVASSIEGILAQRLVRRICDKCKEPVTTDPIVLEEFGLAADAQFYEGKGCKVCEGKGYKGRCGIFEFLVPNAEVRSLILNRAGADDIKRAAMKSGMITLRKDGLLKAQMGLTTLKEVIAASKDDDV